MVEFDGNIHPAHDTCVCHFFDELYIPHPLKYDQLLHDRPYPSADPTVARRTPIYAVRSPFSVTSFVPIAPIFTFDISNKSISIPVFEARHGRNRLRLCVLDSKQGNKISQSFIPCRKKALRYLEI